MDVGDGGGEMIDLTRRWPVGPGARGWLVAALLVVAVVALAILADAGVAAAVRQWPAGVIAVFGWYTELGNSDWILLPSLVLLVLMLALSRASAKLVPKRALVQMAGTYGFVFVAVGLPGLAANLLKRLIGRARPQFADSLATFAARPLASDWQFQSFPSGHATTIFALAFAIGFLSPRWFWPSLLVAVAVALSRVPIGMHYPSDVVAGAVIGTLGAYAVRNAFAARRWVFENAPDGRVRPRGNAAVRRLLRGQRQPAR